MNLYKKRIKDLRNKMLEEQIDAYLLPTADFHQSEYAGDYFKGREFITGFTGSAGTALITMDHSYLWTDGRYWIQAENELKDSGIKLQRMNEPDVPTMEEWLTTNLPSGSTLGFDGRVVSMKQGIDLEDIMKNKNGQLKFKTDYLNEIWKDRPELSKNPAFLLEEKYAGESVSSKLGRIRNEMKEKGATSHILASLEDICWVLNIRGNDISYVPMVLSYLIIEIEEVKVFIESYKLNDKIKEVFIKNNIKICEYNEIYSYLKTKKTSEKYLLDSSQINYKLYKEISKESQIIDIQNPTILMKAMKNPIEIKNTIQAHIKDAIAVTKFMYWLKTQYKNTRITELVAVDKLKQLRMKQEGYIADSFEPIMAYKDHGAMMHYAPSLSTDVVLKEGGFLLSDTGGSYYEGTTDITRTYVIGSVDKELKTFYTAVVRGMINLSKANFIYGCYGFNLDILARGPIWNLDLDYKCGTGHGVGYLSNVHEGPASIRWKVSNTNLGHILEDGMVITNEPGIYEKDKFGIRIENEMIVRKGVKNDYGQFMHFETMTWVPIDLDGIIPEHMTCFEREWLNDYHKTVYEKISPYLTKEEGKWLETYTRSI